MGYYTHTYCRIETTPFRLEGVILFYREYLEACPRGRIKSGGRKDFEEGR